MMGNCICNSNDFFSNELKKYLKTSFECLIAVSSYSFDIHNEVNFIHIYCSLRHVQ